MFYRGGRITRIQDQNGTVIVFLFYFPILFKDCFMQNRPCYVEVNVSLVRIWILILIQPIFYWSFRHRTRWCKGRVSPRLEKIELVSYVSFHLRRKNLDASICYKTELFNAFSLLLYHPSSNVFSQRNCFDEDVIRKKFIATLNVFATFQILKLSHYKLILSLQVNSFNGCWMASMILFVAIHCNVA